MADTLKVLTICGSLRKGSFNRALMNTLPALAPAGMSFTESPSYDSIPPYNADVQSASGFPKAAEDFAAAIRGADAIIIITPEYNWTLPGVLKNAIDWVSRMKEQPFKDKPVLLQSATGGPLGGVRMQYHVRQIMTYLGAFLFGTPEVFVGLAQNKFDEKTLELKDEATKKVVASQLEGFLKFARRMNAAKALDV